MPIELIAEEGGLKGLVLSLEGAEEWIIGRDPDQATLVIEDAKASRRHVLCHKTDEGIVIENLSETAPAQVNDQPLEEPRLLQEGDKIRIGETLFHFYPEGAVAAEVHEEPAPEPISSETIFKEEEADVHFDLTQTARFILKVIAGPNTGAEFALDLNKEYLIGTDPASCDLIFHDLSISREHARLHVTEEGEIQIEDLGSRNGVVVDREKITEKSEVPSNKVVTIGTTAFLVIDREAPAETIAAPMLEPRRIHEEVAEEEQVAAAALEAPKEAKKPPFSLGALIGVGIVAAVIVLFGVGIVSLFKSHDIEFTEKEYIVEIQESLKEFPSVKSTYNKATGKLFLVGHVSTGVDKNALLYNLQGLTFITGIEDNVVVDESIWQEMNILLSKNPDWKGVSLHAPTPGVFVLSGYLKTNKEATSLTDYMNVHFNYLNKLQNLVVVEEQVIDQVTSDLMQHGLNGVTPAFANGELTLTGYIPVIENQAYAHLVDKFEKIGGIRLVRNYVVLLSPEEAIVDLNERYPGRFQVSGFSKHGDVNINVVINGKIYGRGDTINGMTIISMQPHAVFLEKDGLKYKIEYNK